MFHTENGEFKEEVAYYYKVPTNTTYKETVFIEHPLSQDFDKLTLINFVSSTEITLKIYNADSDIKDANVYIATYGNGGKMKDIIPNTSDLALGETTLTIPVDNVSTPVEKIKV